MKNFLTADSRPLIAHVVYRFDTGGLENGVVNLVNHLPREKYRHVIIALSKITEFRQRVIRDDVGFIALEKNPGHSISLYPRLFKLFRELQPSIVHTRNLAALEITVPAWAAGVPARLHSEHGREGTDLDPNNRKYQLIRKLYRPFVTNYLALSKDLSHYLKDFIGIPQHKLTQIYNGVDSARFYGQGQRLTIADCPFQSPQLRLFGTIGRMHAVKDQLNLAKAFVHALHLRPALRDNLRLLMIGDGPTRNQIIDYLQQASVADLCWLPGERTDVPEILRGLDCFVLPSRSEGISNTILEAMACQLPVIATEVGGNPELVNDGLTGKLVPAENPPALASAIIDYAEHSATALQHGKAARLAVEQHFSIEAMTSAYSALYDSLLSTKNNTKSH
ncbi:MAG: sugar transferase [Betaproteobacteria bacterium HGW-Betaproteobacteria-7]|jgi:sugar transferase (PEP-CTERM/EpsH1 system associated)|nr:MAG: sugar transferase [Betaproteobacteria bacterium HGW-Betaproteobacteria-7]